MRHLFVAVTLAGCVGNIGAGTEPASSDDPERRPGDSPLSTPFTPSMPSMPSAPSACAAIPKRIWKLTPEQYDRTVRELIPGAPRTAAELNASLGLGPYDLASVASRLEMPQPHVDALLQTAGDLAHLATGDLARLSPCLAVATVTESCVRAFITAFGTKAFRRPMVPVETDQYVAFFTRQRGLPLAVREALADVIQLLLMAPDFLYRTELGAPMTGHERASYLSYVLAGGPPDAALLAAAASGRLATPAGVDTETRRLLAAPQTGAGLTRFLENHTHANAVRVVDKDARLAPDFTTELRADMARETGLFFEEVLWRGDARLATLLAADYSVIDDRLARIYGVAAPPAMQFVKTPLPGRAGFLTHPSLLAGLTHDNTDLNLFRGKFVRATLLCGPELQLPQNIVFPPDQPGLTNRERSRGRLADAACAGCHRLMDGIGYAYEGFDLIGRPRATELGKPIDTSGTVFATSRGDLAYGNAQELGRLLGDLPDVQQCVVAGLVGHATGRTEAAENRCMADKLRASFDATQGNLREMFLALVTTPSFFSRAP